MDKHFIIIFIFLKNTACIHLTVPASPVLSQVAHSQRYETPSPKHFLFDENICIKNIRNRIPN